MCNIIYMPRKRKQRKTMTEALQKAIADSGVSFKQLERETGVLRQTLMKFVAGEQSIRLESADKLAEYFGIEVIQKQER